ncbi:MAG: hypothetical protein JSV43_07585 [Methanobacteriota archaeon]|nr:MAG: hypothetical protein JSV43_07585 [Euryarchaeota archaeon]
MAADPRLLHTITVELCTAAALFAAISVVIKLASDGYLKYFEGKWETGDKAARVLSVYTEPTAYLMAIGGVSFTFVSMYSGLSTWPLEALIGNEAAHNKMLLTSVSQTMLVVFIAIRFSFGEKLWKNKILVAIYAALAIMAAIFVVLQNSVAGHLAGKGSLLDPFLQFVNVDLTKEIIFPPLMSIALIAGSTGALAITIFYSRRAKRRRLEEERLERLEEESETEIAVSETETHVAENE